MVPVPAVHDLPTASLSKEATGNKFVTDPRRIDSYYNKGATATAPEAKTGGKAKKSGSSQAQKRQYNSKNHTTNKDDEEYMINGC